MEYEEAQEISRLIRRLAIAHRARKVELLRALDLQPGQDVVLTEIAAAGSTSQNEIAAAAEVDEPSVGRSIARLERKGLVKRSTDPTDSRRRLVTLTAKGSELIPELREIYLTIATEAVGDYEDLNFLKTHMREIVERFELSEPRRRGA